MVSAGHFTDINRIYNKLLKAILEVNAIRGRGDGQGQTQPKWKSEWSLNISTCSISQSRKNLR